ncbi:MAG TPA: ferritin [Candidatus Margulisbacteria bacterium]|nr:MAG: ferritin [Candidatus Margulisbacteria bacterium GWD2_39_127]OGI04336.1 MAG: ferritin [Candidatus Margulisbacteria bacterium GWF2_38_17]HAR63687.1 ferritin [Candidatus Margulisiibacteriota bacterium]
MIKQPVINAINQQINAEIYSSYLYLSMRAYFESINLKGFSHWMYIQTQEEMIHSLKFYNFLIERGGKVLLGEIAAPKVEWNSPLAVLEDVYAHELKVTEMINNLVNLAISESDHASNAFLQWYVTEQVEEESSALDVLQKLKLIGDNPGALFLLDAELAKRIIGPNTILQIPLI